MQCSATLLQLQKSLGCWGACREESLDKEGLKLRAVLAQMSEVSIAEVTVQGMEFLGLRARLREKA